MKLIAKLMQRAGCTTACVYAALTEYINKDKPREYREYAEGYYAIDSNVIRRRIGISEYKLKEALEDLVAVGYIDMHICGRYKKRGTIRTIKLLKNDSGELNKE